MCWSQLGDTRISLAFSKLAGMATLIGAYNRSEVITVTRTAGLSNPKDGSAKDW